MEVYEDYHTGCSVENGGNWRVNDQAEGTLENSQRVGTDARRDEKPDSEKQKGGQQRQQGWLLVPLEEGVGTERATTLLSSLSRQRDRGGGGTKMAF